jgi:hypothetical protein
MQPDGLRLHPSGTAETDCHATLFDDDRDLAFASCQSQHPLQFGRVFLDVDITKRNVPLLVILTGGCGVGSSVFAKNLDVVCHTSILWPTRRFPPFP